VIRELLRSVGNARVVIRELLRSVGNARVVIRELVRRTACDGVVIRVVIGVVPARHGCDFAKSLLGGEVVRDLFRVVGGSASGPMDALFGPGMPDVVVLTVEEAGQVLRIGRSLAYQLAARY
jgi:hypothetical protein